MKPAAMPLAEIEDLSTTLTRIARRTQVARRRCANDRLTRALVAAGLSLIEQQFVENVSSELEEDEGRGLLRFISQGAVVKEAQRLFPSLNLSKAVLRDRWMYHPQFIADLLTLAIRDRHWSLRVANDVAANMLLDDQKSLSKAIHEVSIVDLQDSQTPSYRFQLVASATAERDPVVREALHDLYQTITGAWATVYGQTLVARGLQLRPGFTLDMLTDILSAVAEGLALRMLADPERKIIDTDHQTSLLGTAAIALSIAVIDPGDKLSLEQVLDRSWPT